MRDLKFLGNRRSVNSLRMKFGTPDKFIEGHTLKVRVGSKKLELLFGGDSTFDITIPKKQKSNNSIPKQVAIELSKNFTDEQIRFSKESSSVAIIPSVDIFIHGEFPSEGAVKIEKILVSMKEKIGDFSFRDGDFEVAQETDLIVQDIVVRTITSKNPEIGFKAAKGRTSGWDDFVGNTLTRPLIKRIEQRILTALSHDGRYSVRDVKVIPLSPTQIQPVIYFSNRVLNLPLAIDINSGDVTQP